MAPTPFRAALLAAALVLPGVAHAADATIDQVYAEAKSGDVQGALTMMAPVLKDHPNSAKALYVEAELLAHAHRSGEAGSELAKAEALAPGLPGINAGSVSRLKAEISGGNGGAMLPVSQGFGGGISMGFIIVLALVVFGFLALMRRRAQPQYGPGVMSGPMGAPMGGPMGGQMGGMPGGYGPGYGGGMMGGGMGGSGIMGSVGRGLGMGAGFAVGEEVVDHLFGGHSGGGIGGMGGGQDVDPNADMGGQDFGISDSGSWDDGGGGGDGGW